MYGNLSFTWEYANPKSKAEEGKQAISLPQLTGMIIFMMEKNSLNQKAFKAAASLRGKANSDVNPGEYEMNIKSISSECSFWIRYFEKTGNLSRSWSSQKFL